MVAASSANPQMNGSVERYNQTFKRLLQRLKLERQTDNWYSLIPEVVWTWRCHPNRYTNVSPFYFLYGQEPRMPINNQFHPLPFDEYATIAEPDATDRAQFLEAVRNASARRQIVMQEREDELCEFADPIPYYVGDVVLVYDSAFDNQFGRRLDPRWLGPFVIARTLSGGAYLLNTLDGNPAFRGHPINHRRLKLYLTSNFRPSTSHLVSPRRSDAVEVTI
jgi:hypothetical protein